ncbi:hypothetical protein QQZ08_011504 [Neonectria magnoliae]|uniref:BZIP domain-containing protein n=1 Tax=Neonectria magnoliae TaxID=2732573 RepID=A0ABR1H9H8_9HYPO
MAGSVELRPSPSRPHVGLGRPQLAELRDPEDDWTGITKAADRRRRQNRLNQRAYRRRHTQPSQPVHRETWAADGYRFSPCPRARAVVYAFMELAYLQYSLRAPSTVPLPALIRLNALNGLSRNAASLGIPAEGLCSDDLISPFNSRGGPSKWASCPEHLRPTPLQLAIEHHPWSDLLPLPRLRDNILVAITSGGLDEDVLCHDILDVAGGSQCDEALLIVWGDPWDARSWEANVGFLKKWRWLLQGCNELIESTNRWRQSRGEDPLNIRL